MSLSPWRRSFFRPGSPMPPPSSAPAGAGAPPTPPPLSPRPPPGLAVVRYPALAGRPHPGSRMARTVEDALALLPWAAGRVWNQTHQPRALEPPVRLDLLWRSERCVVEIDGPEHRDPLRFEA